jgi:hypothetical protein
LAHGADPNQSIHNGRTRYRYEGRESRPTLLEQAPYMQRRDIGALLLKGAK